MQEAPCRSRLGACPKLADLSCGTARGLQIGVRLARPFARPMSPCHCTASRCRRVNGDCQCNRLSMSKRARLRRQLPRSQMDAFCVSVTARRRAAKAEHRRPPAFRCKSRGTGQLRPPGHAPGCLPSRCDLRRVPAWREFADEPDSSIRQGIVGAVHGAVPFIAVMVRNGRIGGVEGCGPHSSPCRYPGR